MLPPPCAGEGLLGHNALCPYKYTPDSEKASCHMLDPIHPFPARMAPELAFDFLADLPQGSQVLDPMCGSGVALRSAVEAGHRPIGIDADPLAVLMSKVWVENSQHTRLPDYADKLLERAAKYRDLALPWHCDEDETTRFVEFWFGLRQRNDLTRVALAIHRTADSTPTYITRAFQLALSRLIVTKTKGASLAWDVAHSRPHIKKDANDFDVMEEFRRACTVLAHKLRNNKPEWTATVKRGDARRMRIADKSVDAVITSPPYLNAIDYMRGHRLSLVWLGYGLTELRDVRSKSIGTESTRRNMRLTYLGEHSANANPKMQRMIEQYLRDIGQLTREIKRVSRPKAKICIITANSNIKGYEVRTNTLIHAVAEGSGLSFVGEKIRTIETNRRYLPISTKNNALTSRMMEEHIQYYTA